MARVEIFPKYKEFKIKDRIIIKQKKNENYLIGKISAIANTRVKLYSIKIEAEYNKKKDKILKPTEQVRCVIAEDICKIKINKGV